MEPALPFVPKNRAPSGGAKLHALLWNSLEQTQRQAKKMEQFLALGGPGSGDRQRVLYLGLRGTYDKRSYVTKRMLLTLGWGPPLFCLDSRDSWALGFPRPGPR